MKLSINIKKLTVTSILVAVAFAGVSIVLTSYAFTSIAEAYSTDPGGGNAGCCGGNQGGGEDGGQFGGGNQGGGEDPVPPVCNYLKANKTSVPDGGGSVNLSWSTNRGNSATLTPNGASVSLNGSRTVNVSQTTNFVLKVKNKGGSDTCSVKVTVEPPVIEAPTCDSFTANPSVLPYGGGNVTLNWATSNSNNVKLDGAAVTADGSKTVSVTDDKTFTLTVTNSTGDDSCTAKVVVKPKVLLPKCDSFTASPNVLPYGGGNVTLTWATSNTDNVKIDGVAVPNDGSKVVFVDSSKTFTLTLPNDDGSCTAYVKVKTPTPSPECDSFTATPSVLPYGGGNVTLNWATSNSNDVKLDGVTVAADGSKVVNVTTNRTFNLVVKNAYGSDDCSATVKVESQAPSCDSFTASPNVLPYGGGNVTLTWNTSNAALVKINQGIGTVSADGSKVVSVNDDITYILTASLANGHKAVTCPVVITVEDPSPEKDPITCSANVSLTASPTSLPYGGGNVTLNWSTTKTKSVTIDGEVLPTSGSKTVSVSNDKTFTLVAVGNDSTTGNSVSCPVNVDVGDSQPDKLTCSDVSFTASDYSVRSGDRVTLSWDWNNKVTKASINNGIGNVADNGSQTVTIDGDITYTILIENDNSNASCPISIDVESGGGGGGGGSSSPRCTLKVSDKSIRSGDEITLTWTTSNATEITITDDEGNVIVTTDDMLSRDKKDLYDDSIKVRPIKDTTYTLLAERGSRDDECEVDVDVSGGVTVLETRSQTPRVAGIALTQVPYTGFEAGPMLTLIFYALLTLWALFVAYVIVIKRGGIAGVSFAGTHTHARYADVSTNEVTETVTEAADYVASATAVAPSNLPVATVANPVIGYASLDNDTDETIEEFTNIENHAHAKKVLLSSDAMRHLANNYGTGEKAIEALDTLIAKAKVSYPSEDGWIVLNLARLESLDGDIDKTDSDETTEESPQGVGSLAEAIVTGNIVAAYEMIDKRPMVALASAAADLDSAFRARHGENTSISDVLKTETAKLTSEQLKSAISALTSALDGTYNNEAEAVKMAILKATKAVA